MPDIVLERRSTHLGSPRPERVSAESQLVLEQGLGGPISTIGGWLALTHDQKFRLCPPATLEKLIIHGVLVRAVTKILLQ